MVQVSNKHSAPFLSGSRNLHAAHGKLVGHGAGMARTTPLHKGAPNRAAAGLLEGAWNSTGTSGGSRFCVGCRRAGLGRKAAQPGQAQGRVLDFGALSNLPHRARGRGPSVSPPRFKCARSGILMRMYRLPRTHQGILGLGSRRRTHTFGLCRCVSVIMPALALSVPVNLSCRGPGPCTCGRTTSHGLTHPSFCI